MELVLNTFGCSLSRDNEAFVITYEERRQRVPVDGVSSIQVNRGVRVSSDAILLAIEHEIEVLFMDKQGKPSGRVWSPKYGSISSIRRGQLNFSFSSDAVEWIKEIIVRKVENQQALLLMMTPGDADRAPVLLQS